MHHWDPLHPLRSSVRKKHNSTASPSSPTTPKDTAKSTKRVRFADDYTPSSLKLRIVCGPRHDPSLVIYIKLKFDSGGGRPRLGFKIRRPREDERDEESERSESPESKDRAAGYDGKRKIEESEWLASGGPRAGGSSGGRGETARYRDRGKAKSGERGRDTEREKTAYTTEERWPGADHGDTKERFAQREDATSKDANGLPERERRRY